jgi:prevent-host-death family protein
MWLLSGGARALKTIGVRQLKNEATQIVRAVREQHALYVITVNGQPVATLRPYSERDIAGMQRNDATSEIAAIERLADSVGDAWLTVPPVDDGVGEPAEASRRRRYRLSGDD